MFPILDRDGLCWTTSQKSITTNVLLANYLVHRQLSLIFALKTDEEYYYYT